MHSGCGDSLERKDLEEDDIEKLIIQQIEFCDMILLNKASEVRPDELGRIKAIIKALQPKAEIIECDYADVEMEKLLHTGKFDFDRAATSAGWISGIESTPTEEAEAEARPAGHHHGHEHEAHGHEEHGHESEGHEGHGHHGHHDHEGHHHEEGEAEE